MNQQAENNNTLMPCPFCGGEARRKISNDILLVECGNCLVGFHNHVRFGCTSDAEWNTRATRPDAKDSAEPCECDKLRDKLRQKVEFCRECGGDAITELATVTKERDEGLGVMRSVIYDAVNNRTHSEALTKIDNYLTKAKGK